MQSTNPRTKEGLRTGEIYRVAYGCFQGGFSQAASGDAGRRKREWEK